MALPPINQLTTPDRIVSVLRECLKKTISPNDPIQLHTPSFEGNEWKYVKECLDTGWVSSVGKFVDQFEVNLAEYTGSKYCIATANGTLALHAALLLAGVKENDEVLIPDLTFVATANAVSYIRAVPHFVDVTLDTLGVDPIALHRWLTEIAVVKNGETYNRQTGRPIKALVVMHTFGHPAQLEELEQICKKFNLILIEDAAESIGSFYKGRHTGLHGKVAILSFNGNKTITTGGGGAILTQDPEIAVAAKHLTTTAKVPHPWRFFHDQVGYNYRLPNINAALGCAQLEQLNNFVERKRSIASRYRQFFKNIDGLKFFLEPQHCRSNYWLNTLLLDKADRSVLDSVLKATNESGLQTRPVWDLMHTLPAFSANPKMSTPVSEDLADRIICLPSGPALWDERSI